MWYYFFGRYHHITLSQFRNFQFHMYTKYKVIWELKHILNFHIKAIIDFTYAYQRNYYSCGTRQLPLAEQELLFIPEHPSSLWGCYCDALVFCIVFIDHGNSRDVTDKYSHLSLIDSCHIKRNHIIYLIEWGTFR